ncbi:MAG: hypothetical protein ACFNLH_11445, partial [Corynebacterium matruchotii]
VHDSGSERLSLQRDGEKSGPWENCSSKTRGPKSWVCSSATVIRFNNRFAGCARPECGRPGGGRYSAEYGGAVHHLPAQHLHGELLTDADFGVLLEPTDGTIEGGCNGTMRFYLRTAGLAAHSGRAWMVRWVIKNLK